MSRISLEDYLNSLSGNSVVHMNDLQLSALEKNFNKTFCRIRLIAKYGHVFSILLTNTCTMKTALDKLISLRAIHTPATNQYLFPPPIPVFLQPATIQPRMRSLLIQPNNYGDDVDEAESSVMHSKDSLKAI